MKSLTATEYLESLGMKLETTSLLTVTDGFMRQPDLLHILDGFAVKKMEEVSKTITDGENLLRQQLHETKT